jgi:SAM-dependent methyltransferase
MSNYTHHNWVQPDNKNLFKVFSKNTNINWESTSILDFGCNAGNFLLTASPFIDKSKYLGVDVMEHPLTIAKTKFPEYQFLKYNKYHPSYNPAGIDVNLKDIIDKKFDVAVAYSVFTHATIKQTLEELDQIKSVMQPDGVILFTVWDHKNIKTSYDIFKQYTKDITVNYDNVLFDKFTNCIDGKMFINDQEDINISKCKTIDTFYHLDKLSSIIPNAEVLEDTRTGQYLCRLKYFS